jgi:hypothetical protein
MAESHWHSHPAASCLLGIIGGTDGFHGEDPEWSLSATDPLSQAGGLPQANPVWKMDSAGPHYWPNGHTPLWEVARTQLRWMEGYIDGRYGSPCVALNHELSYDWY